ncbi:hypothetical protein DOTSEDRAFT_70053 [Dothistroma septosporum NZE10]|uniref:TNT domain-containing protein n=1 Tax=Dothistroma septosporum (strain NZE10 / CBS 128990) TaxID=675120 RepID=N1PR76_DOTSN|nr:hypothetical protein DOTSEDRAFT_70053 [Dothistroma septosporum NZE10]
MEFNRMRSFHVVCALVAYFLSVNAQNTTAGSTTDPDLNTTRCTNFCAGTNATNSTDLFICGDPRLGPVQLPTALPLDGIVGGESTYHRFGGVCPGEFLAQWTNATTGSFVYPPFEGYTLTTSGQPGILNISLSVGTLLDRFGSEYGSYTSPAGLPYAQRSLPPPNLNAPPGGMYPYNYQVYIVTRTFKVQAGPIAAWFGQQGLGLQFLMPSSVRDLVDTGYLTRLNQTADPLW